MSGWIKLHRQFKDWEWYNKSEMVHLFVHCLVKANFKDGNFQGMEVEKGSFITSISKLSEETNISIQTIRTCLKKLELTKEINIKSTNKLTKITVCKYDNYQFENDETNKQLTNNQQTTNKQLTTIEERKESKEENNKLSFEERIQNFLEWFNNQKEVNGYKKGKFSILSTTSQNNFKKIIKTNYSLEQLNKAFRNMCKNNWVIENNMITPDHFLRIDNFEKYINQEENKKLSTEELYAQTMIEQMKRYDTK